MAVQTAREQGSLKKSVFAQAACKLGWSQGDNGLFAEEHPMWTKQNALQLALKAASKPDNNWQFGVVSSPPSSSYGQ